MKKVCATTWRNLKTVCSVREIGRDRRTWQGGPVGKKMCYESLVPWMLCLNLREEEEIDSEELSSDFHTYAMVCTYWHMCAHMRACARTHTHKYFIKTKDQQQTNNCPTPHLKRKLSLLGDTDKLNTWVFKTKNNQQMLICWLFCSIIWMYLNIL